MIWQEATVVSLQLEYNFPPLTISWLIWSTEGWFPMIFPVTAIHVRLATIKILGYELFN